MQLWSNSKRPTTPKARSINAVVTDNAPQDREANPADEAAIREYLEQDDLLPDERAFFNSLSRDDQIAFLDDSDKHSLDESPRVSGRKP